MKNVILTVLLMVASLNAQNTIIPSDCVTTTNNLPRLFEYDQFLNLGQPFTVEVLTDPNTAFLVAIGLPTVSIDAGLLTGYAPWGTNTCFLHTSDINTGVGVTAGDGRALWTIPSLTCPQLIGTDVIFQAYVACVGCPFGLAPTNGMTATVQ
tara:strand:+ start:91 stop:546 length:456 start_codon:yes stop_codon:yes gene_type:complete